MSAEPASASDRGDRRVMSPSILEECEQLRRAPTESSRGRRSRYNADHDQRHFPKSTGRSLLLRTREHRRHAQSTLLCFQ